jgi:glycosyltransferase involved in cell wall biosynthesis
VTTTSRSMDGNNVPKVSCLMVTANRRALARRALRCFERQTYPNREIVIVDDGEDDLSAELAGIPPEQVVYRRIARHESACLGDLRNLTLEAARGDIVAQWDDDDWYHPERIARQAAVLNGGADACCLSESLIHVRNPPYTDHPFTGRLGNGIPGSILHRRDGSVRYPSLQRGEDNAFLDQWKNRRYTKLPPDDAYLFIRCYHGSNTWELGHFLHRLRNNNPNRLQYVWSVYVRRDIFRHRRFRLTEAQRAAFELYRSDSRALGLV